MSFKSLNSLLAKPVKLISCKSVPSLICMYLVVPELWWLQFCIDRQLSLNFYVFGDKDGQISNFIFLTRKRHFLGQNDVLCMGCVIMCPKMQPVATKKGQKFTCVKLDICPDHPCRHSPLKFCMWRRVQEVIIYFKFHENWLRGLRAVGYRKSPSPIDMAHGLYSQVAECTGNPDRYEKSEVPMNSHQDPTHTETTPTIIGESVSRVEQPTQHNIDHFGGGNDHRSSLLGYAGKEHFLNKVLLQGVATLPLWAWLVTTVLEQ